MPIHRYGSMFSHRLFLIFALIVGTAQPQAEEKPAVSAGKSEAVDKTVDELTDLLMSVAGRAAIGFKGSDIAVIRDEKVIEVSSEVAGRLVLIDIDSNGDIVQLYPNKHTKLDQWKISPQVNFVIPDSNHYKIRTGTPTGHSRLLAIVVPANFDDRALVTDPDRVTSELSVEADPQGYLKTLVRLSRAALGRSDKSLRIESVAQTAGGWAYAYKDYLVTENRGVQNDYVLDEEHPTSQIFLEPMDKSLDSDGAPTREIYATGINLTKLSEGFRSRMYHDAARYCTIGYGHLIKKEPCDGSPEEFAKGLTEPHGAEILKTDMIRAKKAVSRWTQGKLTDGQYAALVDFTFNVGTRNYKKSTLLQLVNERTFNKVPLEFRKWVKAGGKVFPGLQKRREREVALFFDGEPVPAIKSIQSAEMIDIRTGETGE